jgi:hypothetical protein
MPAHAAVIDKAPHNVYFFLAASLSLSLSLCVSIVVVAESSDNNRELCPCAQPPPPPPQSGTNIENIHNKCHTWPVHTKVTVKG